MKNMLQRLLEQALKVEADVGDMPGADEALGWAIAEVEQKLDSLKGP